MSRASGGESAKGARAEALTTVIRMTKADWKVSQAKNRQVFQDKESRELSCSDDLILPEKPPASEKMKKFLILPVPLTLNL